MIQCTISHGQVNVTPTNNANLLAQKLSGPGVDITNAIIQCENTQSGHFTMVSGSLGIDSGILLTTGRASTNLPFWGINGSEANLASLNHGNPGDAALSALAGTTTHDRCILEFDFKANGDSVFFKYAFGSEEYPIFNCANYNDVFAFFISGPGYPVPLNLALIPGTNIPVSINSINSGVVSTGGNIFNCTSMGAGSPFTGLYNSNAGGGNLTYGGFTDLLTARASIIPCSTYHLKLAIADGFDNIIDSGVFFEAGSLASNTFEFNVSTDSTTGSNPYVFEGCDTAVIKIKRRLFQTNVYADTINIQITGTATSGVDYPVMQNVFYFSNSASDTVRYLYLAPFNDLIAEGTESVKLAIYNQCAAPTDSITIFIKDPPQINVLSNDTSICQGKSVNVNATSSVGMTYTWLPSSGVSNVNSLTPTLTPSLTTTYTVTGNYGTCVPVKDSIKINVWPLPNLVLTPTNPLCIFQNNGSINASTSTLPSPFAYNINPGAATLSGSNVTFSNLVAGTYTVTVTDGNNCSNTSSVSLAQPSALSWGTISANPIPCSGGNIGVISSSASGGTGALTYILTPGGATNTTGVYNGLAPGNYTITAKDANNCSITSAVFITQVSGLSWVSFMKSNIQCLGLVNGSINVSASGSAGSITYTLVPGGASNTTGTFTNLNSNTYTITAVDGSGCSVSSIVSISQPPSAIGFTSISKTDLLCANTTIGTITASATGGIAPLNYTLNPGNITNTTGVYSSLGAGTYTVIASDANGCSVSSTVIINSPPAIVISNVAVTNPTCVPNNNGSIIITASGGVAPLEYRITNYAYQFSNSFTGVPFGFYSVQVRDANGCIVSTSVNLPNPSSINLVNNTVQLTCALPLTTINVTANGGLSPYTYVLTPGNISNGTGQYPNMGPGTYTVTVTDAGGCTKTTMVALLPPQLLWANVNVVNVPCNGVGTGSIFVAATNGVAPYSYSINPGGTTNSTGNFSGLALGTYTIVASDVNNCTVSTVNTIGVAPPFTYNTPTIINNTCPNQTNGSIQIYTSGATGSTSFVLSPGGAISTNGFYGNLATGNYTVTGTDATGCTQTGVFNISAPPPIVISGITTIPAGCVAGVSGSLNITSTGGIGTKLYSLNGGPTQTSGSFSNLSNGAYTITISDANNCSVTSIVNLQNPNAPFITSLTSSQVNCSAGLVTLTATSTGGIGGVSYLITPGLYSNTTGVFSGLTAGVYTITVSDANNCSVSSSITVNQPANILWTSTIHTNVSCNGNANGSMQLAVNGGVSPYTYTLNPSGLFNTTGNFTSLNPANYTITASDVNGCTTATLIPITQPGVLAFSNQVANHVNCYGDQTGSLNMGLTGGTSPYTYTMNPGNISNNNGAFNSLFAGSYTITGVDANNCSVSIIKTILEPSAPLQISSVNTVTPTCVPGNNGSITVNVVGGTTAYTYNINGGMSQNSPLFNSLSVSNYTVNVTDANLCTTSSVVSIVNSAAPYFDSTISYQNILCYNAANGTITAPAQSGVGTLTYTLQPGAATNTNGSFINLPPNNYTVLVSDANSCTATTLIQITQPPQLVWDSVDNRDVSCYNGSNGLVTSSASGGSGQITYTLMPVNMTNVSGAFFGLGTGNYTLIAVDTNGCSIQSAFAINQFPQIIWNNPLNNLPACMGGANGSIQITASGGAGGFSYTMLPTGVTNTNGLFNGLTAGVYTIATIDLNNCTDTTTVSLNNPNPISATIANTIPASCVPGCDGSFSVNTSGGSGAIVYSLNGTVFQVSNSFNNLCAGAYTVTVKDANNCTGTSVVTISTANGPSGVSVSISDVSCFGGTNGIIAASLSGSSGSVNYQLQPLGISNTLGGFNNLTIGTYTILATDATGCTISTVASISQPSLLQLGTPNIISPLCNGATNGSLSISGVGGTPNYTYNLAPTGLSNSTGVFSTLAAGVYTVSVIDGNNCSASSLLNISQPDIVLVTPVTISEVLCFGGDNGSISVGAVGGSGVYTYTLQPGNIPSTTGIFLNLTQGAYTIIATDTNSCIGDTIVNIIQPSQLQVTNLTGSSASCNPGNDATITIAAIGGSGVYSYSLNNGVPQSSNVFINVGIGNYTIQVTDANNCTATSTISITNPNAPSITNIITTSASCNPGCDASITITAIGGTNPLNYSLNASSPQASNLFNALCSGSYTISVSDANGCTVTSLSSINTAIGPALNATNVTNITCFGLTNGIVGLNVAGGTAPLTYTILPSNTTNTTGVFSSLGVGSFTVNVSDANGCTLSTIASVSQPPQMLFTNSISDSVLCNGQSNGAIQFGFTGGTGTVTYSLAPAGTFVAPSTFSNLNGNVNYTISAVDANGCTISTIVFVGEPLPLVVDSFSFDPVTCNGFNDGSILFNVVGGTGIIYYSVLPSGLTNSTGLFTNLPGNTYTVLATDANGCTITTSVSILNPSSVLISNLGSNNITCNNLNNGTISVTAGGGLGQISYLLLPNNITNTTGLFTALSGGNYSVVAIDGNGCADSGFVAIINPLPIQFDTAWSNNVLCSGQSNGGVITQASGGTGLISYTIQPIGSTNSTGVFNSLPGNVTYTITASDVNGCTTVSTVFVVLPNQVVIDSVSNTNVTCNGQANASINISASGGTGVIQYLLSPGGVQNTSGIFQNMSGGVFTISATDANNCSVTTSVSIFEPTPVVINSALSTDIICFGQVNGTVSVAANGGISPLTYTLQPSNTANASGIFNGLNANTYTTTVTDMNGCTKTTVLGVLEPPLVKFDSVKVTNVLCHGQSNAIIRNYASGGVGTITYTINPGGNTNTNGIFSSLPIGTYTISIMDANGCTATSTMTITQPQPLDLTYVGSNNITCYGGNDGAIITSTSGGTMPYTYNLLPNNVLSSVGNYTNLYAGTYKVFVSDANGCLDSIQAVTLSQPPPIVWISVTKKDIICYYDTSGTITALASGGTGGIVYSISPNVGQQINPPGSFVNLTGGPYVVTATDASGCTLTTAVTIESNLEIVASNVELYEPRCKGDSNGHIFIAALGGVAPLKYSLNGGPFINPGYFPNLGAGTYSITIMDALGCVKDTLMILTEPERVHATIDIENVKCVNEKNGSLTITGLGGRGFYTYYVKPGLNINKHGKFVGLGSGVYTVSVVDSSFCKFDTTVVIGDPDNPLSIKFDKKDIGCFGFGNEGWAKANVTGGEPPYTYLWNTNPAQTTEIAEKLRFGYYTVEVLDRNGCEIKDTVYIEPGPCCDEVFIPNAFSPNGDGKNDEWRVITAVGLELIQLEIRDRWGNRVWSTTDVTKGWDGTYKGKMMDLETYFYLLRYKCLHDGSNYMKKGDLILMR